MMNLGCGANISWQGLVDKTPRFLRIATKPYSTPCHLLPEFLEEKQRQTLNLEKLLNLEVCINRWGEVLVEHSEGY